MNELLHLEEFWNKLYQDLQNRNAIIKRWFDVRKVTPDIFLKGDLVLKWNVDRSKVGKHKKFESLWSGPYLITGHTRKNAFKIAKLNGWKLPILVNGKHLKYYKPMHAGE